MKTAGQPSLKGRTVLLGLTGSIALYKSCDLVRRLKDEGADVFCLMTRGAGEFVSPLTFSALSGHPVADDVWDRGVWKFNHLDRAERADVLVISPASANTLARLAAGLADDIVTAVALSSRAPIVIAPAMHEVMWNHPATKANVRKLRGYGYVFVGPERGPLTRGDTGWGRLAGTPDIIAAAKKAVRRS